MTKIKKLDYLIELVYDRSYKGYVADVVNLCGCMSQGKTKKEALENVEKAIKAYMEALLPSSPKLDDSVIYARRTVETPYPFLSA